MDLKGNATTWSVKKADRRKINLKQLKFSMLGLWLYVLLDLAPQLEDAVKNLGRHVPCPFHGGKDGFRLFSDAAETGGGGGGGQELEGGPKRFFILFKCRMPAY